MVLFQRPVVGPTWLTLISNPDLFCCRLRDGKDTVGAVQFRVAPVKTKSIKTKTERWAQGTERMKEKSLWGQRQAGNESSSSAKPIKSKHTVKVKGQAC